MGIQATNDKMASISEGLADEDVVVLNLRDHLDLMKLPEIVREDNSSMRDLATAAPADAAGGGRPGVGGRPEPRWPRSTLVARPVARPLGARLGFRADAHRAINHHVGKSLL